MRKFHQKSEPWRPLRLVVAMALTVCGCLLSTSGQAFADDHKVDKAIDNQGPIVAVIDRARLVKIPEGTQTLVIGNPTIADVTMLQQKNLMVLTPKAFGETNFIALDGQGNPLAESTIEVVAGGNALIVQRGMDRESYSCLPRCQPTERLGDDAKYLAGVSAEAEAHGRRLADSKAPSSGLQ